MIVVDTNIITYFLISGNQTRKARALREFDPTWCAPSLWVHEFTNVVATYAKTGQERIQNVDGLLDLARDLVTRDYEVDQHQALQIAVENDVSAYDAQFICLAHNLGSTLVTEDRRLVRQFPGLAKSLTMMVG